MKRTIQTLLVLAAAAAAGTPAFAPVRRKKNGLC